VSKRLDRGAIRDLVAVRACCQAIHQRRLCLLWHELLGPSTCLCNWCAQCRAGVSLTSHGLPQL